MLDDPLMPPTCRDAGFDVPSGAWVLSRYADVLAALRDRALWPSGAHEGKNAKIPDAASQQRLRAEVRDALFPAQLSAWQACLEPLASGLAGQLQADRPVDLVREFAEPWCFAAARRICAADHGDDERLCDLARTVSAAAAEPLDVALQERASIANAELAGMLQGSAIPMAESTFVGIACTLAWLLANGWLALLRQSGSLPELREAPQLITGAVDEMLRLGCIPQRVSRHVTADMELCGLRLAAGDRVTLLVASANRDPARFANPHALDFGRRGAVRLSLGAGPHACVGNALIRMGLAAATKAFAARFADWELCGPVEWRGGSGFRSPAALYVKRRHISPAGV